MSYRSDPIDRISRTRWITLCGLFISLSVLLPIGFHSFGMGGRVFLPMHIPALLAGFLVGPGAGILVGLISPSLSHLLTGMPPTYAVPLMTLELAIYGLVAGITYNRLKLNIYLSLITALLLGRVMFGLGLFVLGTLVELPYTAAAYFASGGFVVTGLPGIVLQIFLIPIVVAGIKRKSL